MKVSLLEALFSGGAAFFFDYCLIKELWLAASRAAGHTSQMMG